MLHLLPSTVEPEHIGVCSVDGEPWPCKHSRHEASVAYQQRHGVLCLGCGHKRNAYTSLDIERGLDGRAVYFHDRKGCRTKAEQWWNENVRCVTDERFCKGQCISDLLYYLNARLPLHVAQSA